MSAFTTALVASAKADEVPAVQMIENLLLAAIQDFPLVLPVADQPLVQGLDVAILPAIKAFLDSKVAALSATPAAPASP